MGGWSFDLADTDRLLARMKMQGLKNQITRRFDRCCHPGKPGDGDLFIRRLCRENRP